MESPSTARSGNLFFNEGVEDSEKWPWELGAREELNEQSPATTLTKRQALESKILEYSKKHTEFKPLMRDTFLMAFLRSRKFDVDRAFKAYIDYFKIHSLNPEKVYPVGKGPLDYPNVWAKSIGTILERRNPIDGSFTVVWTYRTFDLKEDQLEDIFNASLPLLTELCEEPAIQTYGIRFIFDNEGFTFAVFRAIVLRFYLLKVMLAAQGCIPTRFKGFHVINEHYGLSSRFFALLSPFLSSKMRKRVLFHRDMCDLHAYIPPEILPAEFGGEAAPLSAKWLRDPLQRVNGRIIDNSYHGFAKRETEH